MHSILLLSSICCRCLAVLHDVYLYIMTTQPAAAAAEGQSERREIATGGGSGGGGGGAAGGGGEGREPHVEELSTATSGETYMYMYMVWEIQCACIIDGISGV